MSFHSNCNAIILFIQGDILNLDVLLTTIESKTILRALNSGCSGVWSELTSLHFSSPYYSPISRYCFIVDSTLICFA